MAADEKETPRNNVAGERVELAQARPAPARPPARPPATMTTRPVARVMYPVYERPLPDAFYRERWRLTPRDYYRLRAMGFSRDDVFFIANMATATGLDTRVFADALFRGESHWSIAHDYGMSARDATRVRPEWRTPEWAATVREPVYTRTRLRVGID